jgi:probable F420-dependent oxidoreductase
VLILPQRQTTLVAKQAAEVDVLSGGRVRLGVGIGWNPVEYEALGEDFHSRGRRIEEQIDVLRALWTEVVVDFYGRWHQISHAGLNPLPVQRPIPIWIAAGSGPNPIPPDRSLRRIVRLGDGWCPMFRPDDESQEAITRLYQFSVKAGRDPSSLPIEGRVWLADKTPEEWANQVRDWERLGVTRLVVDARMGRTWNQRPLSDHLNGIQEFKEVVAW